ncbi:ferritin-like domain-containing protein [Hymenobacter negativus]|uniref:Ferritin-like domain-containing protein n=1 Tax=Hymenobacter negativus TaxID=2795026 RepID=A0ABS0QAH9_9BACT|nr:MULTISPECIES: ferritin-like domain-containing protein [Bacteria]MBH8559673.1 ferritin-like domain-containing protein [Hymenobacter negativus]MBH8570733.1 ferritin-like domain-containing protein [Hymenobacter negativus]MBR7210470.1 ferritin-like domain-containing protein [Microvirga sp. STS02]
MDFFKIIDQLSEVDADVMGRFDSRRSVFNSLGSMAKRTALAATPLFLGSLFQKAYAGTTSTAVEVLNYALTLELLEADFYRQFIATGFIPTGAPANAIAQIKKHEDAHVKLLSGAISQMGGKPVAGTDTTGVRFKGLPAGIPNTYAGYLSVAQLLEDAGVRAYKGRAGELIGTDLLTTALQIHSVEARHAAHIRTMRSQTPWVSPTDDLASHPVYTSGLTSGSTAPTSITAGGSSYGIPAYSAASPVENNTTQSGVAITTALANQYTAADAAASFDEYLQAAEILDASRAGGLALLS